MKKVAFFAIVLTLLILEDHRLFAQGSGSSSYGTGTNPYNRNTNTSSSTGVYDDTAFEVVRQAKGSILSLDTDYITIKTKKNKLVKIQLTPETGYKRKKNDLTLEELTEGQLVKVFYRPKNSSQPIDQAVTVRLIE